jgi:hypothetical protein
LALIETAVSRALPLQGHAGGNLHAGASVLRQRLQRGDGLRRRDAKTAQRGLKADSPGSPRSLQTL